jgi:glucose-6-phosphate isomerase
MHIVDASHSTDNNEIQRCQAALETVLGRRDIGFHQIPQRENLWKAAKEEGQRQAQFSDDLVVVGIGGSSLGPKALYEIFEDPKSTKKIHFCDNVDAREFDRLFQRLGNPDKTCWVFISKSGSTIETLVAADLIQQFYQGVKKKLKAVVISEKKSNPLTDWAQQNSYPCLEIPLDVGGRFSVLTAVGMFPMAFLGLAIDEFQIGARRALQDKSLIVNLMAQVQQSFQRSEWISFFWFYNSCYVNFGRWLQQLWAESLAKTQDRQGKPSHRVSTPMWGIGSTDQHSLLQQLMDGAKDKFILFSRFSNIEAKGICVEKSQFQGQIFFDGRSMGELIAAQAQGTREALNESRASTLTLQIEDLSPQSLGFQIMTWQLVVAGLGERLDLNAFDQPGVELGKRLAKRILQS